MIYGNYAKESGDLFDNMLLSESATQVEQNYTSFRRGFSLVNEAAKDPSTIMVYQENNINYVAATDLQRLCEANSDFDVKKMLNRICNVNSINENNTVVVWDYCDDYFTECLSEANILVEKAAEDDAVNLKEIMKWYDDVVRRSTKKLESKEDIQDRIKVLKKCVRNMENSKYSGTERVKYSLKALIPFNAIWRLIARKDAYAGITGISKTGISLVVGAVLGNQVKKSLKDGLVQGAKTYGKSIATSNAIGIGLKVGEIAIRAATYNKMLDKKIKETNEAIDFLEKKLKEY